MSTEKVTAPRAPTGAAAAKGPTVAPFDASQIGDDVPDVDLNPFIPQRVAANDLVPAIGVDLSGKPKIVFAVGRGKTGKTTFLRYAAELALADNRQFLMADIDPTNASFSSYFENVSRPGIDDPAGVSRWLQQFIEYAIKHKTSALIDLGGGDTTLRTIATEMPGFAGYIEAAGVSPVVFYLVGTQPDDLAPIATLADRQFAPFARAIVLNEYAAELGLSRQQAFGHIVKNNVFVKQKNDGAIVLWMPRLHAAAAVEMRRSSFSSARDGQTTPPLGLFDRARVSKWLEEMERQFQGVRSWMP
jgi:hypothetical protein